MPEDSLETQDLQEKLDRALERAEAAGEERNSPRWTFHLALSTALVAVLAAIASLQAGALANHALLIKNEAVLAQAKASDEWAYYQAKGIKSVMYELQSEMTDTYRAVRDAKEAKRYKTEQVELKAQAEDIQKRVDQSNAEADHLLHHHHQFALAVTLFQISIALAAIASLTRRKSMWYVGLLLAAAGLVFFCRGWV